MTGHRKRIQRLYLGSREKVTKRKPLLKQVEECYPGRKEGGGCGESPSRTRFGNQILATHSLRGEKKGSKLRPQKSGVNNVPVTMTGRQLLDVGDGKITQVYREELSKKDRKIRKKKPD